MTRKFEAVLRNDPAEIGRLHARLEEACRAAAFPERKMHEVQLALEEHLTNIVRHAFPDTKPHPIHVKVQIGPAELRVQVEDDGRPFNPLDHPPPDLSLPLENRPIGGLGIHMMKNSVDSLDYRRKNRRNILTMMKRR